MSQDQEFPSRAQDSTPRSQVSARPGPAPAAPAHGRNESDPEPAQGLVETDEVLDHEERSGPLQVAVVRSMTVERALGIATGAQQDVRAIQDKTTQTLGSLNDGTLQTAQTSIALGAYTEHMAKATAIVSGHHQEWAQNLSQRYARAGGRSGAEVAGDVVQTLIKETGGVIRTAVRGPVGAVLKGMLGQMMGLPPGTERARPGPGGPQSPGRPDSAELEDPVQDEDDSQGTQGEVPGGGAQETPPAVPRTGKQPDLGHLVQGNCSGQLKKWKKGIDRGGPAVIYLRHWTPRPA